MANGSTALDPASEGGAGRSIGAGALQNADIIVSTTDAFISKAIRNVTDSSVSHAMLYVGDGLIVDATGHGVDVRPLAEAIFDASLAVAYRHPQMTPGKAMVVRDFAGRRIGSKYSVRGIVGQLGAKIDNAVFCDANDVHRLTGQGNCQVAVKRLNMSVASDQQLFCSQLVIEAYQKAGLPITKTPPSFTSPEELVRLRLIDTIRYVGHLKTQ